MIALAYTKYFEKYQNHNYELIKENWYMIQRERQFIDWANTHTHTHIYLSPRQE